MPGKGRGARLLESLSIRGSILVAVVVAASAAVVGGLGLLQIGRIADNGQAVYVESYQPHQDVAELRETLWMVRWAARSAASVPPEDRAPYLQAYDEGKATIERTVQSYLARPIGEAQRTAVSDFLAQWADYDKYRIEAMGHGQAGRNEEQQQVVVQKLNPAMAAAQAHLDKLQEVSDKLAEQRVTDNASAAGRARVIMLVALVACLTLAVVLAVFVADRISRPLRRVGEVLGAVAEGDLTQQVDIDQGNEIGHMAQALNRAMTRIREVLTTLANSSHDLGSRAADLQTASRRLTDVATEAASQVSGMGDATASVTSTIHSVAGGAAEMGASIREISASAAKAAQIAAEAVTLAGSTDEIMSRLGTSSTEIGNVIKLITSIAEQTNLLALNATIEAARAGEAGKGFAVVASEVKDLAQETARATEDISGRVEAIQNDTGGAAASISGVTEVIGQIDSVQSTIASAVEEQSVTTSTMARDLDTAASDAARITGAIEAVMQATESTRQGVQSIEAAASELSATSGRLRQAVDAFRR